MGLMVFRGQIAMVSEWMENGSLMAYLPLHPNTDRIRLVSNPEWTHSASNAEQAKCMDVCVGLCYIHAQGMVGRIPSTIWQLFEIYYSGTWGLESSGSFREVYIVYNDIDDYVKTQGKCYGFPLRCCYDCRFRECSVKGAHTQVLDHKGVWNFTSMDGTAPVHSISCH